MQNNEKLLEKLTEEASKVYGQVQVVSGSPQPDIAFVGILNPEQMLLAALTASDETKALRAMLAALATLGA